jgi:hypothetical protein
VQAWSQRQAQSAFSWAIGIIGVIILLNTVPQVIRAFGVD